MSADQTARRHEGSVGGLSTIAGSLGGMTASFVPDSSATGVLGAAQVVHLPAADRELAMALADALAQDVGHVCHGCPPWPE